MGACCQKQSGNEYQYDGCLLYERVNYTIDLDTSIHLRNEEKRLVSHGYIRKICETEEEIPLPLDIINLIVDFYGLIRSNITANNNPLTIQRLRLIEQGMGPIVHFDENVVVYMRGWFVYRGEISDGYADYAE